MALYSLSALGADAAQLERFVQAYWARLEPLPVEPLPVVDARTWKARLGQRDAINGYARATPATMALARPDGRTLLRTIPARLHV